MFSRLFVPVRGPLWTVLADYEAPKVVGQVAFSRRSVLQRPRNVWAAVHYRTLNRITSIGLLNTVPLVISLPEQFLNFPPAPMPAASVIGLHAAGIHLKLLRGRKTDSLVKGNAIYDVSVAPCSFFFERVYLSPFRYPARINSSSAPFRQR